MSTFPCSLWIRSRKTVTTDGNVQIQLFKGREDGCTWVLNCYQSRSRFYRKIHHLEEAGGFERWPRSICCSTRGVTLDWSLCSFLTKIPLMSWIRETETTKTALECVAPGKAQRAFWFRLAKGGRRTGSRQDIKGVTSARTGKGRSRRSRQTNIIRI